METTKGNGSVQRTNRINDQRNGIVKATSERTNERSVNGATKDAVSKPTRSKSNVEASAMNKPPTKNTVNNSAIKTPATKASQATKVLSSTSSKTTNPSTTNSNNNVQTKSVLSKTGLSSTESSRSASPDIIFKNLDTGEVYTSKEVDKIIPKKITRPARAATMGTKVQNRNAVPSKSTTKPAPATKKTTTATSTKAATLSTNSTPKAPTRTSSATTTKATTSTTSVAANKNPPSKSTLQTVKPATNAPPTKSSSAPARKTTTNPPASKPRTPTPDILVKNLDTGQKVSLREVEKPTTLETVRKANRTTASIKGPARRPATRGLKANQAALVEKQKSAQAEKKTGAGSYIAQQLGGFGLLAALKGSDQKLSVSKDKMDANIERMDNKMLIRVKGRRKVKSKLVELSSKSLNNGDCFILDALDTVYVWIGSEANRMEIAKAHDMANQMKTKDKNGRADLVVIGTKGDKSSPEKEAKFWEILGGKSAIASAEKGGDDDKEDSLPYADEFVRFYEPSKDQVVTETLSCEKLEKGILKSEDAYVLDCTNEIYIWIGKKSSQSQRKQAITHAKELLGSPAEAPTKATKAAPRPNLQRSRSAPGSKFKALISGTNSAKKKQRGSWATIMKLHEGTESTLFKEKFMDWGSLPIDVRPRELQRKESRDIREFDINTMFEPHKPARPQIFGEQVGTILGVWRIKESTKEAVDVAEYGHFYSGENFIVLYKYVVKNRDEFAIFFWQGRNSNINEKGTSAYLTVELDSNQVGGNANQIRTPQNKEIKHFIDLWNGKIIVHKGKANSREETQRLYQVHENSAGIHVAEMDLDGEYLNSNHSFVISTPTVNYVWQGKASSEKEKECAGSVARKELNKGQEVIEIQEGSEPEQFWNLFGAHPKYYQLVHPLPRLFQASHASGGFTVDEVFDYCQDDLAFNDMMILDAYHAVYVWEGPQVTREEKKSALECALEYAKKHTDGRATRVNAEEIVWLVQGGNEPIAFKNCFFGWDDWKGRHKFAQVKQEMTLAKDVLFEYNRTYTVEELRTKPPTVDSTKLETYLNDKDFEQVFGCTKAEFYKQPGWKQQERKKEMGLY